MRLRAKDDPELVERARQAASVPVSPEESRQARRKILRDAAYTAVTLVAIGVFDWYRRPDGYVPTFPLTFAAFWGWGSIARYRAARPRPATPVPPDVLAQVLRNYTRCRKCRTIARWSDRDCPSCGTFLLIGTGFYVALAVGLLVLFGLLILWAMA